MVKKMQLIKIKNIKYIGQKPALNITMKKNKNFMLANGILTHNTAIVQNALRNIMETFQSNVIFILTCNSINRIEEAIKSRCVNISFAYPPKEEVYKYLEMICNKELMKYDKEGLDTIIQYNYPSIRNCVVTLQDLKIIDKEVVKENIKPINAIFDDMWNLLKQKDWKQLKKLILESTLETRDLNIHFWNKAIEEENIKVLQICCRNERDMSLGADSKIIFTTSILEMIK
jgi:DNA polymerase III delta prime subunit